MNKQLSLNFDYSCQRKSTACRKSTRPKHLRQCFLWHYGASKIRNNFSFGKSTMWIYADVYNGIIPCIGNNVSKMTGSAEKNHIASRATYTHPILEIIVFSHYHACWIIIHNCTENNNSLRSFCFTYSFTR